MPKKMKEMEKSMEKERKEKIREFVYQDKDI